MADHETSNPPDKVNKADLAFVTFVVIITAIAVDSNLPAKSQVITAAGAGTCGYRPCLNDQPTRQSGKEVRLQRLLQ
jgi:hypothetical protein